MKFHALYIFNVCIWLAQLSDSWFFATIFQHKVEKSTMLEREREKNRHRKREGEREREAWSNELKSWNVKYLKKILELLLPI